MPVRADGVYQQQFLLSTPALDLLLPFDDCQDIFAYVEINELMYFVSPGKAFDQIVLMLMYATYQVVGHARVKRSIQHCGHDVDVILPCKHALFMPGFSRPDAIEPQNYHVY